MYQSPDVIKVVVNVKDVFASYTKVCDPVNMLGYTGLLACPLDDPNYFHVNMLEDPNPYQCYQNLNAP